MEKYKTPNKYNILKIIDQQLIYWWHMVDDFKICEATVFNKLYNVAAGACQLMSKKTWNSDFHRECLNDFTKKF